MRPPQLSGFRGIKCHKISHLQHSLQTAACSRRPNISQFGDFCIAWTDLWPPHAMTF